MKRGNGSATAIAAATLRAVHQLIDGDEKLLYDPIILQMMPDDVKTWVLNNRFHYYEPESMAFRTHIVLRSRYAEDCLKEAFDSGVRQFVILGAGMDTFAYRQPKWATALKILEVDHPASQAEKKTALVEHKINIPSNLSFLPLDLEKEDLRSAFEKSKINLKEPIFMACLGVLIYLSKNCIDKIFKFAGTFAKGSEFVFTISQKNEEEGVKASAARVAAMGEPWLTHFNHKDLQAALQDQFSEVFFLTPEAARARYFEGTNIQLAPPKRSSLVKVQI
jgi:methyltransferase (TIGR00027 family)